MPTCGCSISIYALSQNSTLRPCIHDEITVCTGGPNPHDSHKENSF